MEENLDITNFANPLALRCIEVPLLVKWNTLALMMS